MTKKRLKETYEGDTYSYKGWLQSDSIIKRSFAVLGHNVLATMMLYIGFFIFVGILALIL
jgi:hypothetical protein